MYCTLPLLSSVAIINFYVVWYFCLRLSRASLCLQTLFTIQLFLPPITADNKFRPGTDRKQRYCYFVFSKWRLLYGIVPYIKVNLETEWINTNGLICLYFHMRQSASYLSHDRSSGIYRYDIIKPVFTMLTYFF